MNIMMAIQGEEEGERGSTQHKPVKDHNLFHVFILKSASLYRLENLATQAWNRLRHQADNS